MSKRLIVSLLSGAMVLGAPFLAFASPSYEGHTYDQQTQTQTTQPTHTADTQTSPPPADTQTTQPTPATDTQSPQPAADTQTTLPPAYKNFGQHIKDIRHDFKDVKKELKEQFHEGELSQEDFKARMEAERAKMEAEMAKAKAEHKERKLLDDPDLEAGWRGLSPEEKAALEAKYRALANYGQEVREIRHDFNETKHDLMERFLAGTLTEEEMRAAMREAREKMEAMLAKEKEEAKDHREEMKNLGLPAAFRALSPEEQAALEAKFREAMKERRGYGFEVREIRGDFNDMKKKMKELFREGELTREEFKARIAAEKAKMEETIKNLKLENQALLQEIRALKEQLNQR